MLCAFQCGRVVSALGVSQCEYASPGIFWPLALRVSAA